MFSHLKKVQSSVLFDESAVKTHYNKNSTRIIQWSLMIIEYFTSISSFQFLLRHHKRWGINRPFILIRIMQTLFISLNHSSHYTEPITISPSE